MLFGIAEVDMHISQFAHMNYQRARANDKNGQFNLDYYLIALVGEVGEFANKVKKMKRDFYGVEPDDPKVKQLMMTMVEEAADIMTYSFLLQAELIKDNPELSVEEELLRKYEIVNQRLAAGGFDKRPENG